MSPTVLESLKSAQRAFCDKKKYRSTYTYTSGIKAVKTSSEAICWCCCYCCLCHLPPSYRQQQQEFPAWVKLVKDISCTMDKGHQLKPGYLFKPLLQVSCTESYLDLQQNYLDLQQSYQTQKFKLEWSISAPVQSTVHWNGTHPTLKKFLCFINYQSFEGEGAPEGCENVA
jgi:hypothetical protein